MPTFLKKYEDNLATYEHDTRIYVIGDLKSPDGIDEYCASIKNCFYITPHLQNQYMLDHGHWELSSHLPWNTIARRNVGHLMAYEDGMDVIVMLDDDNLATNQDVVKHHSVVGQVALRPTYASTSGWFNVCRALVEQHDVEFYARGYPPAQRWKDGLITSDFGFNKVAVNGGLWLNDPDIDALTRIERHLITTGVNPNMPTSFALYPGTWSPWNCQNTAISRRALASYFLSPHTGRHLDIWASYITTRVAEAMGEVITFGTPLAFHDRTPHNLYKDLEQEMPWIRMTDKFVDTLRSIDVKPTSYSDGLSQVIEGLHSKWDTKEPVKGLYLEGLLAWNEIFSRLGD